MNDPIRVEQVENGWLTETWDHNPSPSVKTTHVFEIMDDLLQHILDHFVDGSKVVVERIGKGS